MSQSLGLLEVAGLLSAIAVADVMVKTANVRIIAVEEARGNGWMTVKIEGSVDAVNAAIDAGVAVAKGMNVLISKKVIARPDQTVYGMFASEKEVEIAEYEPRIDTDALVQDVEKENIVEVSEICDEVTDPVVEMPEVEFQSEEIEVEASEAELQNEEVVDPVAEEIDIEEDEASDVELQDEEVVDPVVEETNADKVPEATCNLCLDPRCGRRKGEFKTSCLHYIK